MLLLLLFMADCSAQITYSCNSVDFDVCNMIQNGDLEDGISPPSGLGVIFNGELDCWGATQCSACDNVRNDNTPDILDADANCCIYAQGCNQQNSSCIDIPCSFISNNEVNVNAPTGYQPSRSNTRYSHLLISEAMFAFLQQTLEQKKYYLEYWSAPASCLISGYSILCFTLTENYSGSCGNQDLIATFEMDNSEPGSWQRYGACIDLSTVPLSTLQTYRYLVMHFTQGDEVAYDDFRMTKLADAGDDATLCNSGSVVLGRCCIQDATYSWSPSTGLSCTDCCNPTATPSVTTTYTLTVTSPDGQCTDTDQVTVTVNTAPDFTIDGNFNSCTASAYCATGYSGSPTFTWAAYYNSDPNNPFTNGTGNCSTNLLFAQDGFIVFSGWYAGQACTTTVTLEVFKCCFKTGQGTLLDDTSSSTAFPSGTVTGGTYFINNTFTVNSNLICNGVDFEMGPYAKIIITNDAKLTLKKPNGGSATVVKAGCNVMWDQIEIQQGSELLVQGSTIQDGITAVISQGGAKFTFESNSYLIDNYRSIVINAYAGTHPGIIKKTTITGNTSLPLAPYHYEDSYSGIEVNDVTSVTLGDAIASANSCTIKNVQYGIIAKNSSVTVKNMQILDLLIPDLGCHTCQCTEGTGICAYTTSSTARSLIVGGSGSYDRVTFQQAAHGATGIHAYGKINTTATYNSFLNLNTGIMIENASGISYTQNLNNNTLEKFTTGINCKNMDYSTVNIGSNSFNAGVSSGTIGTYAIIVQNVNSVPLNLSITGNGTSADPIHRIKTGIMLTKVCAFSTYSVSVNGNYINFSQLNGGTVTGSYYGIRLQNCVGNEIGNNVISKPNTNPEASTVQKLRGISFENSGTSHIFQNELTKMGSGIYGLGACNSSKIECNSMTNCYEGCYFNSANIGHQIAPNTFTNNRWYSSIHHNLEGNVSSTTYWYYDPSIAEMNPFPYNCTNMIYSSSGSANSLCAAFGGKLSEEQDSLDIRDELIGDIVSGENDYVTNDAALKTWDEQFAYSILTEDSGWLDLGSNEDALYQNYYDSISITNTGWIQKSIDYISNGKFDSASYANENINATNEIESNRKTVNEILLVYSQMELPVLDSEQIKILTPIAYSDPLNNGEAVYTARVLLGIDPDGNVKYENYTEEFSKDENRWMHIYPNPASDVLNIEVLSSSPSFTLNLYSITGKLVLQTEIEQGFSTLNISDLKGGVYIIQARTSDLPACYDKLIVTK